MYKKFDSCSEDLLTETKYKQKENRNKAERQRGTEENGRQENFVVAIMSGYSGVHYTDIYDPEGNPGHRKTRYVEVWDTLDDGTPICYKKHIHYEGYGQRYCREKMCFLESINVDHPLWSPGGYGKSGNTVGKREDSMGKSLVFNEEADVKVIGENEVITELIDGSNRSERTSWNFNLMLAKFVEKCPREDRPSFFEEGFYGEIWTKDMEMMKDFKRMFDWIDAMKAADKNKKISLADQSVKNYPFRYYEQIKELYMKYMEKKLGGEWWTAEEKVEEKTEKKTFKFNPKAAVFVPRVIFSAPMEKENPPKPEGPAPEKSRPHSTNGTDHLMPWRICEESDKKILELDRKLQMLINLHGPVVEAQQI